MVEVRNNPKQSSYEIFEDGQRVGLMAYQVKGDVVVASHTETEPGRQGQGLAGQLVRVALDEIRASGRYVDPQCSFVRHFVDSHPDYQDLVKVR